MIRAEPIAFIQPPNRPNSPISVYFEDQHFIVLSKPSGLLSQGETRGDPNLVDTLRNYWGRNYVGLVHRLDRNTSGLMIVAKRSKAAQRITSALQKGEILRTYLGWIVGTLAEPLGTPIHWHHQLKKNQLTNLTTVVVHGGKEASLQARPIRTGKWGQLSLTLVEFTLETGRSHQIRAQTSYEGFPLLGDSKYGPDQNKNRFQRLALHSFHLELKHPMSGETLTFEDPLPQELNLDAKSTP